MQRLHNEDISSIDYIFSWQGNPNILLAMVKLIEDRMNVADDVATAGVQTIILVEDSVRYYSSYLPMAKSADRFDTDHIGVSLKGVENTKKGIKLFGITVSVLQGQENRFAAI